MADGPKISSCEEHLQGVGVLSSQKSIPSGDVHVFQRFKGHRIKKGVFGALPENTQHPRTEGTGRTISSAY